MNEFLLPFYLGVHQALCGHKVENLNLVLCRLEMREILEGIWPERSVIALKGKQPMHCNIIIFN
jgi:hypothetical protein